MLYCAIEGKTKVEIATGVNAGKTARVLKINRYTERGVVYRSFSVELDHSCVVREYHQADLDLVQEWRRNV